MRAYDPKTDGSLIPTYILDLPLGQEYMRACQIVVGVDSKTNEQTVFHGKSIIADVELGRAAEWGRLSIVRFAIDYSTDEPERLAADCRELKGCCDFAR